ncbi:MAG: helix-turn-helix transcriptional regulator [Candidatus Pacebacteria bacterium]|nr:helix-turn-helix transcriptional regulator [Candidatus Paceibacterota bacterium]
MIRRRSSLTPNPEFLVWVKNLREVRLELNQEDLADMSGVAQGSVSKFFAGGWVRIKTIKKIGQALVESAGKQNQQNAKAFAEEVRSRFEQFLSEPGQFDAVTKEPEVAALEIALKVSSVLSEFNASNKTLFMALEIVKFTMEERRKKK